MKFIKLFLYSSTVLYSICSVNRKMSIMIVDYQFILYLGDAIFLLSNCYYSVLLEQTSDHVGLSQSLYNLQAKGFLPSSGIIKYLVSFCSWGQNQPDDTAGRRRVQISREKNTLILPRMISDHLQKKNTSCDFPYVLLALVFLLNKNSGRQNKCDIYYHLSLFMTLVLFPLFCFILLFVSFIPKP